MNEAVRDVDQLLLDGGFEVEYVDGLIVPWCGVLQPTLEANGEAGIPSSNVDAVWWLWLSVTLINQRLLQRCPSLRRAGSRKPVQLMLRLQDLLCLFFGAKRPSQERPSQGSTTSAIIIQAQLSQRPRQARSS